MQRRKRKEGDKDRSVDAKWRKRLENSVAGAIFNGNDVVNEVALKEAARRITQFSKKYNVTVLTRRLRDNDSYQVSKTSY